MICFCKNKNVFVIDFFIFNRFTSCWIIRQIFGFSRRIVRSHLLSFLIVFDIFIRILRSFFNRMFRVHKVIYLNQLRSFKCWLRFFIRHLNFYDVLHSHFYFFSGTLIFFWVYVARSPLTSVYVLLIVVYFFYAYISNGW